MGEKLGRSSENMRIYSLFDGEGSNVSHVEGDSTDGGNVEASLAEVIELFPDNKKMARADGSGVPERIE